MILVNNPSFYDGCVTDPVTDEHALDLIDRRLINQQLSLYSSICKVPNLFIYAFGEHSQIPIILSLNINGD
jgi:hypothetical protein